MSPSHEEERILRDAVLTGDGRAWEVLYARHFDGLYAFIRRRTEGEVHWTEDVLQESLLIAVRRLGDFDPARGAFGAWLRGIALHVLRNQRRGRERRRERETVEDPPQKASGAAADPGRDIELAEEIAFALAALPPRYREVLQAKYEAELSVEEIAARCGETRKAVESLLSRARGAFREVYRRLGWA